MEGESLGSLSSQHTDNESPELSAFRVASNTARLPKDSGRAQMCRAYRKQQEKQTGLSAKTAFLSVLSGSYYVEYLEENWFCF